MEDAIVFHPAAEAGDPAWGPRTGLNLSALTTTPGEMAAALERAVLAWYLKKALKTLFRENIRENPYAIKLPIRQQ